jgi:pimeloyl-ACP methyl ester carboxylesterase
MMHRIQSKNIKINGLDIHYFVAGQGDPLVVVHGGAGGADTWMKNIAELAEKYTVYAPDLPGFGESQPLDGNFYIPELTEFMDSFSDNLGLDRFHLVGHSLGGGVALNYALQFPHKIVKLVLISSLCLGREIAFWVRLMSIPARFIGSAVMAVLQSIKWILKTLLAPVEWVLPLPGTMLNIGSSITTFKEQTLVLANRLSEIMVPTLLVWGANDPIVPVRHAYAAAQVIRDCQLKVFEGCGHNVHRDEIQQFSHLITGFLG